MNGSFQNVGNPRHDEDRLVLTSAGCIHQLLEEQVARTPEAVAVVFEETKLTYGELNQRANQLAHYLRRLGVRPEVRVGLCVERSAEMVIGLLGVLKAGGAYVPLDPAYPQERRKFMLDDSRASLLLTQERLTEELPAHAAQVVFLDRDWECIRREPEDRPVCNAIPDDLAYVLYTSGSTGIPKGVAVTNSSLYRYIKSLVTPLLMTDSDVYLHTASISFSASVRQLMLPLCVGSILMIASSERTRDPRSLLELISVHGVTIWDTVPSIWRHCIHTFEDSGSAAELPLLCDSLRQVLLTGEVLKWDLVRAWARILSPGTRIVNLYSQTETTGTISLYVIKPDLPTETGVVPLGRPVGGAQIHVLDDLLRPVPIGTVGELYVGGSRLARGYFDRPELTAERFLPDPCSGVPGARLYKTGDKARYLANGDIEPAGRVDSRLKIHGFRIELMEIEIVLCRHPGVQDAAVDAREGHDGEKRLVAYIVSSAKERPSIGDLRSFLSAKLPWYMIPGVFLFLNALPLSPNGKIDRQALPAPDTTRPDIEQRFVPPRNPIEEVLAKEWAEVLGLQRVGVLDDFFELGGDSLAAMRLFARLRNLQGVQISLRHLLRSPTVAELAREVGVEHDAAASFPPLVRRAVCTQGPSASFAQERLWFLHQLDSTSPVYNVPAIMRLAGSLNLLALERALSEIVRQHEALRTTFEMVSDRLVQVVATALPVSLVAVDLSEFPEGQVEAEIGRRVIEETRRPFDLVRGPLIRATLLRVRGDEHVLIVTIHHIASDGWSRGVLYRELGVLYEAFHEGRSSPLPELPVQYADFALWQREWLEGATLQNLVAYWKRQLAGAPARLELPADRPRPSVQTFRGARRSWVIPKHLSDELRALSRREGATLFMTLLAAFKILLSRYSGQNDIVLGTPVANRIRPELEPLIGFFVNTLVLRTDLGDNPTFLKVLERVREVCLEAQAHQNLPFERLVEETQPDRSLSRNPLFQVMFVLQNSTRHVLKRSDLVISASDVDTGTAKFDLTLELSDTPEGLTAQCEYSTDLFDEATIERMLWHYQNLLEGIISNPGERLSDLPIMATAEQHKLLVDWNDTMTDSPGECCIHQLFEAQVERTPEAVAVIYEGASLTYRDLDHRANQLAHSLQSLGVGPEVPVAICVERSLEMVVGLLGILKAGGAYVPLDPSYPSQRLAYILEDARAPVLLTQRRLSGALPKYTGQVLCLDDWDRGAGQLAESSRTGVRSANLAYVIYTSGSTGRPKGVAIEHHSTVTLLHWATEVFSGADRLGVLASTSICFDLSVFELFLPLGFGGTVILVRDVLDLKNLPGLPVTLVNTVPSAMAELVRMKERPLQIRTVNLAGEPLRNSLAQKVYETGAGRVFNLYGPTEDTTYSTFQLVERGLAAPPPIGRPIANTQVYVLDAQLQPVPIGVPGELYIAGAGLARGYLNRPELTAEKFIPNPFSAEPGARMYKSGDRVQWQADGTLEFLGRLDHQVKIRGFRVELGEIEAVLSQHPSVREAVVLAREDTPGERRLVAYVVPTGASSPSVGELRRFLHSKLPDYMLPATFMLLQALPLTPSGKVDRRSLPSPERLRPEQESAFGAARTPIEQVLARIWADMLGLEQVGVHDDFFVLGGHSLLATQLVSRVRDLLHVDLPLRLLFEAPTVAELSAVMSQDRTERARLERIAHLVLNLARLQDSDVELMLERKAQLSIED